MNKFDPSDDWFEDPKVSDQEKLKRFYSLNPTPTPAPAGEALKYFIQLKLAELNVTLDAEKFEWLNDESVSDDEKRQWIVGALNQTA